MATRAPTSGYSEHIARPLLLRPPLPLQLWPSALYPAALLLALALPFQAIQPVVSTPWLSLTDDKVFIALVALAWLLSGLPTCDELTTLLPAGVLLLIAAASAITSDFPDDSLRATGHLALAALILLVTLRVAREGLLWAIVGGAGLSAVLGIAEALGWPAVDGILRLFKIAPTRVGGELRISASFQYATIAAMYFEMAVPIAIALAASARTRGPKIMALGSAVLCTLAVVLTLTRAGMLTLAVVVAILLAMATRKRQLRKLLRPTLLVGAVLATTVTIDVVRDPVFDLRLVTENDATWYGAVYAAPDTVQVEADQPTDVTVDVRNAGRIVWSRDGVHPFALAYRWLTADGSSLLDVSAGMVALPHDVPPGETVPMTASIDARQLPGGTYRLVWFMSQQDVVQFYERGWPNAETTVRVQRALTSPQVARPALLARDDAEAPWVVPRLNLWQAAIQLIERKPVLGVGPDNFRHLYGAELGLDSWDERVQANNLYLELLVDMGVLGLAAFGWLVVPALSRVLIGLRSATVTLDTYWLLGVGLAVLAFLIHGLLDTFLAFTPTAVLFAMCLGFVLVQKPHVSGRW